MLTETDALYLARPVYCVLGSDFFTSRTGQRDSYVFDLRHIQKLIQVQGVTRFLFAAVDTEDHLIHDQLCENLGLHFAMIVSKETMTTDRVISTIQSADIVYAPLFCQTLGIRPTLMPPCSVERLLHVVEYFATTGVPFSPEEYNRILV